MSDSGIKELIENHNPAVMRARIATLEAERDKALRFLQCLTVPLQKARSNCKPSSEPQNVTVQWTTGSVTVVELLEWLATREASNNE